MFEDGYVCRILFRYPSSDTSSSVPLSPVRIWSIWMVSRRTTSRRCSFDDMACLVTLVRRLDHLDRLDRASDRSHAPRDSEESCSLEGQGTASEADRDHCSVGRKRWVQSISKFKLVVRYWLWQDRPAVWEKHGLHCNSTRALYANPFY